MDRDDILSQDQLRNAARAKLRSDIENAKQNLSPKSFATRWKNKQKANVDEAKAKAGHLIQKNAVSIAAMGIAALLFAARQPILKAVKKRRSKAFSNTSDKDPNNE